MRALATLLILAASACAYQVTQPTARGGWTNVGPQTVAWERVSTDPANFTIVLINQQIGIEQVLVAEQDGVITKQVSVNPPSGGWTEGRGFRVNLVQNVDNLNTIYAQSPEFAIQAPNSTSSGLLPAPRPTSVVIPPGPIATSPSTPPEESSIPGNSGAATITANTGLMALCGAVAYLII